MVHFLSSSHSSISASQKPDNVYIPKCYEVYIVTVSLDYFPVSMTYFPISIIFLFYYGNVTFREIRKYYHKLEQRYTYIVTLFKYTFLTYLSHEEVLNGNMSN